MLMVSRLTELTGNALIEANKIKKKAADKYQE